MKKAYGLERIYYIRPYDRKPTSDVKLFATEEERELFFERYVNRKFSKVIEVKFFDAEITNEKIIDREDMEYKKTIKRMAETFGIPYEVANRTMKGE